MSGHMTFREILRDPRTWFVLAIFAGGLIWRLLR